LNASSVKTTETDKIRNISRNIYDIVKTEFSWATQCLNRNICCFIVLNFEALSV